MAVVYVILGVFTYFIVVCGHHLKNDKQTKIVWPEQYHFSGEKLDLMTMLKEPFEIWYSSELNRSRIDLYGGENKKYYYGDKNTIYSVFPVSKRNMLSMDFCGWRLPEKEDKLELLPDTTSFIYTGHTMDLFDKIVYKLTANDHYKHKMIREQTLYVHKTDCGVDIPVQYVTNIFKEKQGNPIIQVINNYHNFNYSVSYEDVSLENADKCELSRWGDFLKHDVLTQHSPIPTELDIMFDGYTKKHNKVYHESEILKRKLIFENNWRIVEEHNRSNFSYRMELNSFSDRTPEELKYLSGTLLSEEPSRLAQTFPHTIKEINKMAATLPTEFDLRLEGVISPVKYQGSCGSCWAFATAAALEGALARVNGGQLLDLSEQSLLDCSWSYYNMGCDGGFLDLAWSYIYENGVPTEFDYGYIAHDGRCHIKNMTRIYNIKGYAQVTPRYANALKVALYKYGPVSVTILATPAMLHYSNGIFYDFGCEGKKHINHAVTVVGYGVRDGEEYWLVKNSWGETWGEDGYILMSARNNNCLILDSAYYPIV